MPVPLPLFECFLRFCMTSMKIALDINEDSTPVAAWQGAGGPVMALREAF